MKENEKLVLDATLKSAAVGFKATIELLNTVHYLLARVEGDLSLRQKLDPSNEKGTQDYLVLDQAYEKTKFQIDAVRKLQGDLITIRNGLVPK